MTVWSVLGGLALMVVIRLVLWLAVGRHLADKRPPSMGTPRSSDTTNAPLKDYERKFGHNPFNR